MITKVEMMAVLVGACPSFERHWQAFRDEWRDEADLPLYLVLGDFARHLIAQLERGQTADFADVFAAIERIYVDGDGYVQEAATLGLLEDMQNLGLHQTTKPEQFQKYLGPVSKRWWDKLNRFWDHGELLADD
ncbi:MAG TPA: hypothetical protein VGZ47_22650 [Gemmataceae bacterium]|jgi:hypothetical protein|nr:hypothetical protein [Gemmataceae bacterium]